MFEQTVCWQKLPIALFNHAQKFSCVSKCGFYLKIKAENMDFTLK